MKRKPYSTDLTDNEWQKKIKGRKRHVLVDTQGLVLKVTVHPANVMDRDGVTLLLPPGPIKVTFLRLTQVWLDAGYNGKDKGKDWIEKQLGWTAQMVKPPPRRVIVLEHVGPTPRPAFTVLPRRWVIERTFSWWGHNRRLSKEYERLCASSEAMIYVAMSRLRVIMKTATQSIYPSAQKGPTFPWPQAAQGIGGNTLAC